MATRKRIADLSAALTADTREYEEGMKRAANVTGATEARISGTMRKLETVGVKLGLGLIGGGGALSMLTREIRHVIDNIEKIPGVPASTVASVQQTRYAFEQSKQTVDQAIASVVSFASWTARAAGFLAGAMVYGLDSANEGYWEFARAAENAASAAERQAAAARALAAEEAAYQRVLAAGAALRDKNTNAEQAAIDRLQRARESFERMDETGMQKLTRLRQEAALQQKIADSATAAGRVSAASVNARAAALEKLVEADAVEEQLVEEAQKHLDIWQDFFSMMSGEGGAGELAGGGADAQVEKIAKATKEAGAVALELGWAFSSAFEDAILSGEKLSDVVRGLGQDILRIAIRTAITQPIGQAIGGAISSMFGGFGFGGGKASGGPVEGGTTYLVGEKGPELFTPGASGAITPNHKLGGAVSAGGHTFNIDARGADRTGLARLEAMIRELHGTIETRAIAAVSDNRRRAAFA